MAPEQARGDDVDGRTDLYALGTMMFEMITGVLPFEGKPIDMLAAKLKRDVPAISDVAPALIVDPLVERFVRKLLERKIERRFASARAALTVLALLQTDRAAASSALGITDVEAALALISLPKRPPR